MLHPDVERTRSGIEGSGLVATKRIARDTVIWRVNPDDQRVTDQELLKLSKELHRVVLSQGKKSAVITTDGAEYLNHSCDRECPKFS